MLGFVRRKVRQSSCHAEPLLSSTISLESAEDNIRRFGLLPHIQTAGAYRLYYAIGLTRAFAEFHRLSNATFTLTDFLRLHSSLFSEVAPWAGKLRSKHTEAIVYGHASAASYDIRSEMRLLTAQFKTLINNAISSLDFLVAIAFIHARIIYIQPAAEENECLAQVLTDLQLRRFFNIDQLASWPRHRSYSKALISAGDRDLTPLIWLLKTRLQELSITVPIGQAIQSPFCVLSRNWTAEEKQLPNSQLLLSAAFDQIQSRQAPHDSSLFPVPQESFDIQRF